MTESDLGLAGEVGPTLVEHIERVMALTQSHDLRHVAMRPHGDVRHDAQAVADEEPVFLEPFLRGAHDHPFQVVEVRRQVALLAPSDDLDRNRRSKGSVVEHPAGPLRAGGGHRPDQGALLGHDRAGQAESLGERHGACRHTARHERNGDASTTGLANRQPGPLADDQIVADQRAVDVEGDEFDGQGRLDHQRDPARPAVVARSTCASRGLPDRSGWIRQDHAPGSEAAAASTAGP